MNYILEYKGLAFFLIEMKTDCTKIEVNTNKEENSFKYKSNSPSTKHSEQEIPIWNQNPI